jgi:hypothetical protein
MGSTMTRPEFLEFAGPNPADCYFVYIEELHLDAKAVVIAAHDL